MIIASSLNDLITISARGEVCPSVHGGFFSSSSSLLISSDFREKNTNANTAALGIELLYSIGGTLPISVNRKEKKFDCFS